MLNRKSSLAEKRCLKVVTYLIAEKIILGTTMTLLLWIMSQSSTR